MVAQRRYSVTGQTPPEDAEAMKARSPKLQALDTNVPPTGCGLCEGAGAGEASIMGATASEDGGPEAGRGRKKGQAGTIVRTSSKRSATQLPSPNSPTQCLPPKMARYRLGHHDDYHMDLDTDTDLDSEATDDHSACPSHAASTPESSLPFPMASLPDAPRLEQLQLCAEHATDDGTDDDYGMDDFALSPSHSRNHSLDRISFDEKHELQASWDAYQKAALLRAELETIPIEQLDTQPIIPASHPPLTFLTLPPEIRHQIYRNCDNIVLHKPLVYCISTFHGEMQHPLASVSRLVRAEALAIFYSYNLWVIKVEFRIMYDAFQDWIIRLGTGAGLLRLISFSVRGSLFKPRRTHTQSVVVNGQLVHVTPGAAAAFDNLPNLYSPPDGDASFHIDLSEKFVGGKVELVRNDGTSEAGDKATAFLGKLVHGLWEKRRAGTLNGQDWISMVDGFISFVGGW
ncbi:hypothetical protein NX059_000472 [Plenodomus lindquistii]|nr:hypothetical protein NX059_000472 [Plenodomus lindquistii]